LAPANCQACASYLKACTACCKLGVNPSNTQSICFQMIQAPRIQKELKPLLRCFCSFLSAFFHQTAKEDLLVGVSLAKSSCCRMAHQNCLAKTQDMRMCWIVSSSWSQSTHHSGCCNPLFSKQSTVQQRFRIASQTNVLHFPGAHDFQSLFHGSKVIEPTK